MSELLIEELRGGLVECEYAGHICGVAYSGDTVYRVGNPDHMTYLRSAAKPFQAIPSFRLGIGDKFGLTGKEQAIMTASHRSEPFHVEVLTSMLGKIGVLESDLVCHSSYPLNVKAKDALVEAGKPPRRLYHNCSGKHLGILALCVSEGYPLAGYDQPEHPAQQAIIRALAELSEYPQEHIHIGIDGCGFPVFALPLSNLAKAYLKLACPELIADPQTRAAVEKMTKLMNEHYEMVSGTDMICSTLLMDDNIVAKGGAKGVYCFGLRKERTAFALKVMDGSEDKWPMIVASILEQIGYDRTETIERLYRLCPKLFANGNGTIVGENRPVFRLQKQ
ncbi:asparaginase [Paenibacillus ginsengarvi]|uniref:Asparaginase n=1 Tax=Paenibacillus ginsengarvi TaxID=400777 RepID=A0A3B0BL98_9BACL|nr:asparaginase [Paenibacillus ginsengarvi]RKN72964.1 asparaginase [Paenibacillus ginsengarvi]